MDAAATPELIAGVADGQCTAGRLLVTELRSDRFDRQPVFFGEDNYHVMDYALFYLSLRRNAVARVDAWYEAAAAPVAASSP